MSIEAYEDLDGTLDYFLRVESGEVDYVVWNQLVRYELFRVLNQGGLYYLELMRDLGLQKLNDLSNCELTDEEPILNNLAVPPAQPFTRSLGDNFEKIPKPTRWRKRDRRGILP
ncbi:MAG: hypothetical protein Q8P68_05620 [Candidatus Peregrinibacteria bacterium]|nr:hypothetical protein [Candidatus Peregrinibacteria bacterium]